MPVFGGNIGISGLLYGMKILAQDVRGVIVPNSGHWIAEEQTISLVVGFEFGSKPI